jgi:hypothetical protein
MFRNRFIFYGEGLLAPRPTPKLEDHPLSSVRGCLFNVFAANFHYWRPSLYPRPEDTPCCGDRDPPNMVRTINKEIKDIVRLLKWKSSHGYDEIPQNVLKISLPFILSPLTYMFNKSLGLVFSLNG